MKVLIALAVTLSLVAGQYPFCQGTYNNNSLVTNPPVLLNKSDHGLKYMITDPNDNTTYAYIAVLEGSPYEMGYAMGTLFKEEVTNIMAVMEQFIKDFANSYIDGVAEWIVEIDSDVSEDVQLGLNLERIATAHFTPERFTEEMQGMADASGVPFNTIQQINLYPELIRAHCSIGGFWNPATLTGKLLQLRTLDWDAECPMNYFPTIIIRHSTENGSNPFAVLGWAGVIGALAGYSPLMGISEADWLPDMDNETTIFGKPWMYVLRDVLQFGTDLESGLEVLQTANRTYKVYLGIGSSADNQLRGVQYEALNITIYSDQNWSHPFSPVHPQFDGIMYWDKSSAQNRPCFGNIFAVNYGNITAETLWQVAAPMDTTGDTMVAVYDWGANFVYVSYSDPATGTPAYSRPLMALNMTYLFSQLPSNTEFTVTE